VSIIKEHQVTVLIFTGRDFSLGVTERAKQELCFYIRRRLEPTPSGDNSPPGAGSSLRPSVLPNLQFGSHEYAHLQCAASSHRI
jgi:hypothetical protein